MLKIDTEKSITYRYDRLIDLVKCVEMLGENGYFSDDKNFQSYDYGTLSEVRVRHKVKEGNYLFVRGNDETDISCYKYFIPEDKVVFKEEPKKLRPFKNISEFSNETGCEVVGEDIITIRNKNDKQEKVLLFTGYSETAVNLGAHLITFNGLLYDYEFYYDDKWLPFGIEE